MRNCLLVAWLLGVSSTAAAQVDTVRAAPSSWSAPLVPGVDTTDAYVIRSRGREHVMVYIESVERTARGWLITQRNILPTGTLVSLDSVELTSQALAPLWHSDVSSRGRRRVSFADGRATGSGTAVGGDSTPVDLAVPRGALDFSVASVLTRLLALRPGYRAVLLTVDIHHGVTPVTVHVEHEVDVEVGGQVLKTWKVIRTAMGQTTTHWIDQRSRAEVRVAVEVGNGNVMVAEARHIRRP